MSTRVVSIAIVIGVGAAIAVGISIVGSPRTAREDRFDDLRAKDLLQVVSSLRCKDKLMGVSADLPVTLDVATLNNRCEKVFIQEDALIDNETGQPHTYKRLGNRKYLICATFHDAERLVTRKQMDNVRTAFDPKDGCVSGQVAN
ncbi:hypothetical protein [Shimia sediminis]|uniref:hypothetical protein n=1 Tax=Shimia sediminis TaxID=2497945 RepID=UPI000F8CAD60|nr:hypothetical protein [Shimia sediminis]